MNSSLYQMFILKFYFVETTTFVEVKVKISIACVILSFYLNKTVRPASFEQWRNSVKKC